MSPLCVSHPREIASVIYTIGEALLIKGALTIITFGIKLPGQYTWHASLNALD